MKTLLLVACGLALAVPAFAADADPAVKRIDAMIGEFKAAGKIDTNAANWKTTLPKPSPVTFSAGKTYSVRFDTSKGPMLIELRPDVAPMHVTSFLYLARLGFFDGLTFHRVIPGFMAQGGCPLGNGRGGPGYRYGGEIRADVGHDGRGVLSTANTGQPNTDGSQFFLTFAETSWLDGKHTVFGRVVEGLETLDAIEKVGSSSGRTRENVVINAATVEVK